MCCVNLWACHQIQVFTLWFVYFMSGLMSVVSKSDQSDPLSVTPLPPQRSLPHYELPVLTSVDDKGPPRDQTSDVSTQTPSHIVTHSSAAHSAEPVNAEELYRFVPLPSSVAPTPSTSTCSLQHD